jgi:hypothetical protein
VGYMPLIDITTHRDRHPADHESADTELQHDTYNFGHDLARMIVENCEKLGLDPDDTPFEGVQVNFRLYHPRVINGVDMWIKVQFAEHGYDQAKRERIRTKLKSMILGWFVGNRVEIPDMALDIFWGPDNGFILIGDLEVDF